jgi:hypothetical protein
MTYAVIAKGIGPHRGWKRVEDIGEIFGVFWVDSTLTRPSRPMDMCLAEGKNQLKSDDFATLPGRTLG